MSSRGFIILLEKSTMLVIIRDDQGVGAIFKQEKYSLEEITAAKDVLRDEFRYAAELVFERTLHVAMPQTIRVNLEQDSEDEEGSSARLYASYTPRLSREDLIVFNVKEFAVRLLLKGEDREKLREVVIHEMIHAADSSLLNNAVRMVDELQEMVNQALAENELGGRRSPYVLLTGALAFFDRYRAEGIAVMGSHLLLRAKCDGLSDLEIFKSIFCMEMERLDERMLSEERNWLDSLNDWFTFLPYGLGPNLLLSVLNQSGRVETDLVGKVKEGFTTGDYCLTDDEVYRVLSASMSLTLSEYIKGILNLGEKVAPMQVFLRYCSIIQTEYEAGNRSAFARLMAERETFNSLEGAMKTILGMIIPENEIDGYYQSPNIGLHPRCEAEHPQMKQKVEILYDIMKNSPVDRKRKIAQWALSYLYDDQDVIYDDIVGFGYIDDMMVIDYALRLLRI